VRATALFLCAMLAAGCAPQDAEYRLTRTAADTRSLAASLDRLEERLLENQARVRSWRELRSRPRDATVVARPSRPETPLRKLAMNWAAELPSRDARASYPVPEPRVISDTP
jgi:hypothetical protein